MIIQIATACYELNPLEQVGAHYSLKASHLLFLRLEHSVVSPLVVKSSHKLFSRSWHCGRLGGMSLWGEKIGRSIYSFVFTVSCNCFFSRFLWLIFSYQCILCSVDTSATFNFFLAAGGTGAAFASLRLPPPFTFLQPPIAQFACTDHLFLTNTAPWCVVLLCALCGPLIMVWYHTPGWLILHFVRDVQRNP